MMVLSVGLWRSLLPRGTTFARGGIMGKHTQECPRHLQSEWEHRPYPSPRRKAHLVPVYVVWDGLNRRELCLRKCFTLTMTNRALMEVQVGVECQA